MQTKELATDRIRAYPTDGKWLRLAAKKKGGKTTPADIIRELREAFKKKEKNAA